MITSWEDEANAAIGPALGLPAQHPDWKYGAVGRFATGRPWA
ncbi:hypothetical protein [Amycolatopsis sp. NPDC004079]